MDSTEKLISRYGFEFPKSGIAEDVDQAVSIATEIGFPVVMKIASEDIVHKTDVGGVELNLTSENEVREAFTRILSQVKELNPRAEIQGIRVEEMCQKGVEIILGLNNDQQFGPTIMFGLGGIFTEILREVSFRVLPITKSEAQAMIKEIKGHEILDGYRGREPVSREMLTDLILQAGKIGEDLWEKLDSVDLNPISAWGNHHRVLDAKVLLQKEAKPLQETTVDITHLDKFFTPESVALVGASSTPGKIGNAILDSLVNHEYEGEVYPVNPKQDEIMGLATYNSVSEVPESVDLVVIAVSLKIIPAIIEECAEKGVHNVVIVSGGGKELGGKSQELEAKIARVAKKKDVRIIGPNCIGVFNGHTRLDTFFQTHERMDRPTEGNIAVLTQSGTVGCALLEKLARVGISKFVSYGNRLDVDEADLVSYLANDPSTKIISCYIEGLGDGRKFMAQAKKVVKKKPIVVFKAGRTPQAADASVSHTGFFGGTYEVYRGAFKQAGLIDVNSFEEFYATIKGLAMQPKARGNKIAIISNGAGTMVQAIDILGEYDLKLSELAKTTLKRLRNTYPDYFIVQNPLDVTGSATSYHYEIGIEALLDDPKVDMVMPWFVFQDTPLDEGIIEVLDKLSKKHGKPILCGAMGGSYTEKMSKAIESKGIPVFHSVREWQVAARGLSFQNEIFELKGGIKNGT